MMPSSLSGILTWLQGQLNTMLSVGGNVLSNHSAPARTVLIYTVVWAAVVWLVIKIVRKAS